MTPETDALVGRLREAEARAWREFGGQPLPNVKADLFSRAADTIERLTAQLAVREDVREKLLTQIRLMVRDCAFDHEVLAEDFPTRGLEFCTHTACAAVLRKLDQALSALRALPPDPNPAASEREAVLRAALERIAEPLDCGCVPCMGQCTSQESLAIELEARMEEARAALSAPGTGTGVERAKALEEAAQMHDEAAARAIVFRNESPLGSEKWSAWNDDATRHRAYAAAIRALASPGPAAEGG